MDSMQPFETAFWIFFGLIALWILFGLVQMLVMRERNWSKPARGRKAGSKPGRVAEESAASWGISGMSASDMQVGVGGTATASDLSSSGSDSVSYETGDTSGGGGDFSGGGGDGGGGGSSGGWND